MENQVLNTPLKAKPAAGIAKTTTARKKKLRSYPSLANRVLSFNREFLKGDDDSFFVSSWSSPFAALQPDQMVDTLNNTLPIDEEVVGTNDPEYNTSLLLNRVREVEQFLRAHFDEVSGVYIGKTTTNTIASRFDRHWKQKCGMNSPVILQVLQSFRHSDIPPELLKWGMTPEKLAFLYEDLLIGMCMKEGVKLYAEEETCTGGGGKIGDNDEALVYALFVVYNNDDSL